jgi:hypothetical protein
MAAADAGQANLNVCSPDAGRPVRNAGRARDFDARERDSNTGVLPGIRDLQSRTLTSQCSTLKGLVRKGALILVATGLSLYRLWKDIGREPSGWSSLGAVRELWVTAGSVLERAHSHSTRSFLPSTPRRRNTVGTAQASYVCGARQVVPRAYTPSLRPPRIGRVRALHIFPRACRHG